MTEITLETFEAYLNRHYNNYNTRKQYSDAAKRFYIQIDHRLNKETIDKFFSKFANNSMNRGFVRAFTKCFNITDIDFPTPKSRAKTKAYSFLSIHTIKHIIENTSKKTSVMVSLAFDTGLRLSELVNLKKENIDLVNLEVSGIGKGNKEFKECFSKRTEQKLRDYLFNKHNPFPFHYQKVKHSDKKFWRILKSECLKLGIPDMHPHRIRHSLGHHLRVDKGWDLEQIREKFRHSDITTTRIYSTATKEEVDNKIKREVFEDV